VTAAARQSDAKGFLGRKANQGCGCDNRGCAADEVGGTWYWVRDPDDEKRVVMGLFNRYCIRCHGVDGRGVWDIPGVPDFTNARWQACRSDGQLVRSILEGRGACMPPFRGTLALDEAWAMARYLRTFIPGTEVSRPDVTQPATPAVGAPAPPPASPPAVGPPAPPK
jgi:mono/diheme cytochrome c family protein